MLSIYEPLSTPEDRKIVMEALRKIAKEKNCNLNDLFEQCPKKPKKYDQHSETCRRYFYTSPKQKKDIPDKFCLNMISLLFFNDPIDGIKEIFRYLKEKNTTLFLFSLGNTENTNFQFDFLLTQTEHNSSTRKLIDYKVDFIYYYIRKFLDDLYSNEQTVEGFIKKLDELNQAACSDTDLLDLFHNDTNNIKDFISVVLKDLQCYFYLIPSTEYHIKAIGDSNKTDDALKKFLRHTIQTILSKSSLYDCNFIFKHLKDYPLLSNESCSFIKKYLLLNKHCQSDLKKELNYINSFSIDSLKNITTKKELTVLLKLQLSYSIHKTEEVKLDTEKILNEASYNDLLYLVKGSELCDAFATDAVDYLIAFLLSPADVKDKIMKKFDKLLKNNKQVILGLPPKNSRSN